MHGLHLFVALRKRKGLFEIEGVLHLAGRVVLRLEEGVEVPERLLDDASVEFGKAHFEEELPHLADDPLIGVDLAGVCLLRELGDIIPAQVFSLPCTGKDLFAGERSGLFAQIESFLCESKSFGSDGNGIPDGLAFLQDPALHKFLCLFVVSGRVFQGCFVSIG